MKKIMFILFVAIVSFSLLVPTVMAGNEEIIIKKLVDKGVLSESEAEELQKKILIKKKK